MFAGIIHAVGNTIHIMSTDTGKRILIVDDEPQITEYLVHLLASSGFQAWAVNNPLKALAFADEIRPDLIIMDFVMPMLLGPELALLLKRNASTRNTPVIFLSGMSDQDHRLIASISGGVAYLDKPVSSEKLFGTISHVLRETPSSRSEPQE
jgi:two-component system phosphate regulon response regulator PhoB